MIKGGVPLSRNFYVRKYKICMKGGAWTQELHLAQLHPIFSLTLIIFDVRLREIQMSEYDAEMYESFSSRVRRQVQSLRVILDSLQARGKERVWLRNQTSGELDDGKLIEGLTGERAIYKKRGEEDPEVSYFSLFVD